MYDDNRDGGNGGLVGLISYVIIQVMLFVAEYIWWILGALVGALLLYILIRHFKKINLNEEMIWEWVWKFKRQLFYVLASAATLIVFRSHFWVVFSVICTIWIVLFVVHQLVRKFFGCRVCDETGKLTGYSPALNLEFDNDVCYACGGKHLVFKDGSDWYRIALKAKKEITVIEGKLSKLTGQFQQYSSGVKIGGNTGTEIINDTVAHLTERFEINRNKFETSLGVYREIEKKAHIFLYNIHLRKQINVWGKDMEYWDIEAERVEENANSFKMEVEWNEKLESNLEEFEGLMYSEASVDITDDLRLDIEKATLKLKKMMVESA